MEYKVRGHRRQEHSIVMSDCLNSNLSSTSHELWVLGKLFLCLSAMMLNLEEIIGHTS